MSFFGNGRCRKIFQSILFGLERGYPEIYYPDTTKFSLTLLSQSEKERLKKVIRRTTSCVISVYGGESMPELFGNGQAIREITATLSFVPPALYAPGAIYGDEVRRTQAMRYLDDYLMFSRETTL
jgi:hypothetical protein